jgi:hypothetical protein
VAKLIVYQTFPPGPGEKKPLRSDETPPRVERFMSDNSALEKAAKLIRHLDDSRRKKPYSYPPFDKLEIECDDGTRWNYAEVQRQINCCRLTDYAASSRSTSSFSR